MNGEAFQNRLKVTMPKVHQKEQQHQIHRHDRYHHDRGSVPLRGGNIDIGPDQRERPQREAEYQCDPSGDRHRLRLRVSARLRDMPRQPASNAEHRNHADREDDQHDPPRRCPRPLSASLPISFVDHISSQITERYRSGSKYSEAGLEPVMPASAMKKSLTCCSHFVTVPST